MSLLAQLADELGMPPEALEAALSEGGESESLTPNYLTTNPDGTTSATFTGHIVATGVDLQTGDAAGNFVRWIRTSDNALVAEIGSSSQTDPYLEMSVRRPADDHRMAALFVIDHSPSGGAQEVWAYENQSGPHKIIDSNQLSNFIQVGNSGLPLKARMSFGSGQVNIANGANNGTNTFAHQLGNVPTVFWANARNNPPLSVAAAKVTSADATNVTVQAYTANLAAVSAAILINCDWFAIG